MSTLTLVLLIAAAGVAVAQLKCETPQAWEGRLMEINHVRDFDRRAKISYDEVNQRTRIIEEIYLETDKRDFYDEIFLHKEQRGYRLNLRDKTCENFTLREPFHPIGVPSEARYLGQGEIGSSGIPGAGVTIQFYGGDTTRGRYGGEWIPLGSSGCLPVSDVYIDRTTRSVVHWNFYDLTVGISNPNVFNIPEECRK